MGRPMMDDIDGCTCEACVKEVSIETPTGSVRLENFIGKLTGSYFDHPDCRIAVDEYDDLTAQSELAL